MSRSEAEPLIHRRDPPLIHNYTPESVHEAGVGVVNGADAPTSISEDPHTPVNHPHLHGNGHHAHQASSFKLRPPPKHSMHSSIANNTRMQMWKGAHKFICHGRVLIGSDIRTLSFTCTLLAVSWAMFFCLIAPRLESLAVTIGAGLLALTDFVLFILTIGIEPGLLPHLPAPPRTLSTEMRLRLNMCAVCNIARPARTKHCHKCNACCEDFDHHCVWTGTCIGKRNYRFFFFFVLCTFTSAGFAAASSLYIVLASSRHKLHAPRDIYMELMFALVGAWYVFVLIILTPLAMFHLFILSINMSTYEYLRPSAHERFIYGSTNESYHRISKLFCTRVPKSKLLPMHEQWQPSDYEEYTTQYMSLISSSA